MFYLLLFLTVLIYYSLFQWKHNLKPFLISSSMLTSSTVFIADPDPFLGVLFNKPLLKMCLLMESPKLRDPATLPVLCICIGVPVTINTICYKGSLCH